MTPADTSGVTVALTLNAPAGLNYPAALNARTVVTGPASTTVILPPTATMTGA